jgi:hypothetical protein
MLNVQLEYFPGHYRLCRRTLRGAGSCAPSTGEVVICAYRRSGTDRLSAKTNMTRDAFVVVPFSSTATCTEAQWTEIYENVFHPAFDAVGYSCERAKPMVGTLAGSIIDRLRTARIVLADVTDRNPNVFYELGIRHCLRKGTILVAQGAHHIPSDLKGYWFVDYGTSPGAVTRFKAEIARLTAVIESAPEKSDNPVADYLDREKLSIYGHIQRDAIKKLGALGTELTGLRNVLAEVPKEPTYADLLSCDCLKLLCQTMYVDVGPELLKVAYELTYKLEHIRRQPIDARVIRETQMTIEQLTGEVDRIREMMIRGEFTEPATVSTMLWVPIPESARMPIEPIDASQVSMSVHEVIHNACHPIVLMTDEAAFPHESIQGALHRLSIGRLDVEPSKAAAFPLDRAARRKPCPCGSGKLLKNCCGRG